MSEDPLFYKLLENRKYFVELDSMTIEKIFNTHFVELKDRIKSIEIILDICSVPLNKYSDVLKQKIQYKTNRLRGNRASEYQKYKKSLENVTDEDLLKKLIPTIPNSIRDIVSEETEMYNLREKTHESFHDMLLLYLIVIFEEFVENMLETVFKKHKETLRTKNTITYEEIVDNLDDNHPQSIISYLSQKRSNSIRNESIECIAKYFENWLKPQCITGLSDWRNFTERFSRRHVITHNSGFPNQKYNEETKLKENMIIKATRVKIVLKKGL